MLEFARPDNVILTNLGVHPGLASQLMEADHADLMRDTPIITNHHLRGADELPHHGLKEFASEKLPFQQFAMNTSRRFAV